MYLTQGIHRAAQQFPNRTATVCGARRRSWAELRERVARWGAALRGLGLREGGRVALLAPNLDSGMEFAFGTWWAGGVINPVNTRWSAEEIAFSLEDSGTCLLLADASLLPLAREALARMARPCPLALLRDGAAHGLPEIEAMLAALPPAEDLRRGGDALAGLFYTGGTTGRPKGVMLSHRNFWSAMVSRLTDAPVPHGHVVLHTAPLFQVAGFGRVVTQSLLGGTGVFLPSFDVAALLDTVEREGVTDLMLVPTMLDMILRHPDFAPARMRSIARISYGAAPIQEALLDRALAALPHAAFMQAYGMTETWGVIAFNPPENHAGPGRARLGRTGRAYSCAEIAVTDEAGREVPRGTVGEVVVRGPQVMLGYWNRPVETAAAFRDGWLRTGDAAWMDEEGYVTVVDRIKDMIISGGENVYSAEVENAIGRHPDVLACAVIGIPSAAWGEAVHAVVVPRPGAGLDEAAIRAHCRALIAGYKVPKTVEFRDALPLSRVGKVLKSALREPFRRQGARAIG